MRPRLELLSAARRFGPFIALAGLLLHSAAPARAWDWPHLGLYGTVHGDGFPVLDSTGALDNAVLDEIARYHEVILNVDPITPYRPDVIAALRARRSDLSLLGYVHAEVIWDANNADSLAHIPTRINHTVRNLNGFLYNTRGAMFGGANINLAKRDAGGRQVVAEAMADLFSSAILATGVWDGLFLDVYCHSILWWQVPGDSIDYRRAGYADLADFDIHWRAGADTLANRLRRLAGPAVVLVGNCEHWSRYTSFNGGMRENFPFQDGGTWYSNMYRDPGGYFADEEKFRTPPHNYIFSAVEGGLAPYSPTNVRKVRFGLGTASLGSGFGVFGPSDRRLIPFLYHEWWYDEYAVDLATGSASTDVRHTGWLGQPLGGRYQMAWVGTTPDASTNPDFETDVTSGWTFYTSIAGGIERDATTYRVGTASAHVSVPTTSIYSYSIGLQTTGSIGLIAGLEYAATFWARAATPRTIRVTAAHTGPGEFTSQAVSLDTTWQHYQVVLVPPASGPSVLALYLGAEAGDVWLDDVHFQQGATSVYRRDFQNGIVLVNPSRSALSVPLEREYQKIAGRTDPATNDGAKVTTVTLPPGDALFLIGTDLVPPASVTNLRRIP